MTTLLSTISDELILAAVERADLHTWHTNDSGVILSDVVRHVGLPRTSRGMRARLMELVSQGTISKEKRHGLEVWVLTSKGKRRLSKERRAGTELVLPESPQHQAWKNARTVAGEEIGRFTQVLRERLEEAEQLLLLEDTGSDAWFMLSDQLRNACWRVGSATYCLKEWVEPDDAKADREHLTPAERKLPEAKLNRLKQMQSGRREPLGYQGRDA